MSAIWHFLAANEKVRSRNSMEYKMNVKNIQKPDYNGVNLIKLLSCIITRLSTAWNATVKPTRQLRLHTEL